MTLHYLWREVDCFYVSEIVLKAVMQKLVKKVVSLASFYRGGSILGELETQSWGSNQGKLFSHEITEHSASCPRWRERRAKAPAGIVFTANYPPEKNGLVLTLSSSNATLALTLRTQDSTEAEMPTLEHHASTSPSEYSKYTSRGKNTTGFENL